MNPGAGIMEPWTGSESNREELLAGAAEAFDSLLHYQGEGGEKQSSEAAQVLRLFTEDAVFADRPEVYPIAGVQALNVSKFPVAVEEADFTKGYKYYLIRFPYDLHPSGSYGFNRLQVRVDFYTGEGGRRPKVQARFPGAEHKDILGASAELEVKVEPNLEFAVNTGKLNMQFGPAAASAEAGGKAKLHGSAGLELPPLSLKLTKALVNTTQAGLEYVWWEISGTELKKESGPSLLVILQTPATANILKAVGRMEVGRYYRLLQQLFRNITQIPRVYREFIEAGVPKRYGPVNWDLSEDLAHGV